ncbi:hypothetical protein [Microbispora triticiradicis]|uniref:Ada DNA repair metal-binding domain-containing protein n=2 Tax=Microbispora TaxID=2005 RepID=A0ABY3LYF4_9ACTN|nr:MULTISPECIES: hypothetical protein [Microbispora]TLP55094.1 hypothetical protein FED44_25510 [Microbispora fusca]TYB59987.1 hypothetical protein FXF59_13765 [Microbispora tritici]
MILISAALVLAAIVLLIAGVVLGTPPLVMWSIVVSVLSAVCLLIGALLRRHELFPSGGRAAEGTAPTPQGSTTPQLAPVGAMSGAYGGTLAGAPAHPVATPMVAAPPVTHHGAVPPQSFPAQPFPSQAFPAQPFPPQPSQRTVPVSRTPATAGRGLAPDAIVLVIPGRRRFHLATCRQLVGRETEELTYEEAREEGFTPCTTCLPETFARTAEPEEPAPGDSATGGDTAPGDAALGDTGPGDAASGEAADESPARGETPPGDSAPGDTALRADAPRSAAAGGSAARDTALRADAPSSDTAGDSAAGDATISAGVPRGEAGPQTTRRPAGASAATGPESPRSAAADPKPPVSGLPETGVQGSRPSGPARPSGTTASQAATSGAATSSAVSSGITASGSASSGGVSSGAASSGTGSSGTASSVAASSGTGKSGSASSGTGSSTSSSSASGSSASGSTAGAEERDEKREGKPGTSSGVTEDESDGHTPVDWFGRSVTKPSGAGSPASGTPSPGSSTSGSSGVSASSSGSSASSVSSVSSVSSWSARSWSPSGTGDEPGRADDETDESITDTAEHDWFRPGRVRPWDPAPAGAAGGEDPGESASSPSAQPGAAKAAKPGATKAPGKKPVEPAETTESGRAGFEASAGPTTSNLTDAAPDSDAGATSAAADGGTGTRDTRGGAGKSSGAAEKGTAGERADRAGRTDRASSADGADSADDDADGAGRPAKPSAGPNGDEAGDARVRVMVGTRRFHSAECPLVSGMDDSGVETMTRAEAESSGLTPCSVCQGG